MRLSYELKTKLLDLNEVFSVLIDECKRSRGSVISFRTSKIIKQLKNIDNKVLAASIIKSILDKLCTELNCTRINSSRGTIYVFSREKLLKYSIDELLKLCEY